MIKCLFIAIAATGLPFLAAAGLALADGGPHGAYSTATSDEDKCARCHRVHLGKENLIRADSVTELCFTCHDGSHAPSNVRDGVYTGGTPGDLNGGLFGGTTGMAGLATSVHDIWGAATQIPDSTGGKVLTSPLSCNTCHDPHGRRWTTTDPATYDPMWNYGTAPATGYEQYRMLRGYPDGTYPWVGAAPGGGYVKVFSNESPKSKITTKYKSGTVSFCASCHDLNLQFEVNEVHVRHPVDVELMHYQGPQAPLLSGGTERADAGVLATRLEDPNAEWLSQAGDPPQTLKVVCLTCHRAHGTKATMTGTYSAQVYTGYWPAPELAQNPAGVLGDTKSFLLLYNNRGVCQNCHQK